MFYFCGSPVDLSDMETESVRSNSAQSQASSQDNEVSMQKLRPNVKTVYTPLFNQGIN